MPHRHLNALTAELLASIEETRRRIAESEDQLQRLMAEAREKLAQSYRLLHWAGKILSGDEDP